MLLCLLPRLVGLPTASTSLAESSPVEQVEGHLLPGNRRPQKGRRSGRRTETLSNSTHNRQEKDAGGIKEAGRGNQKGLRRCLQRKELGGKEKCVLGVGGAVWEHREEKGALGERGDIIGEGGGAVGIYEGERERRVSPCSNRGGASGPPAQAPAEYESIYEEIYAQKFERIQLEPRRTNIAMQRQQSPFAFHAEWNGRARGVLFLVEGDGPCCKGASAMLAMKAPSRRVLFIIFKHWKLQQRGWRDWE